MADVLSIIEKHFWEPGLERSRDELSRDFAPFSTYRGMNANMHGIEALLTAFEATGGSSTMGSIGGDAAGDGAASSGPPMPADRPPGRSGCAAPSA